MNDDLFLFAYPSIGYVTGSAASTKLISTGASAEAQWYPPKGSRLKKIKASLFLYTVGSVPKGIIGTSELTGPFASTVLNPVQNNLSLLSGETLRFAPSFNSLYGIDWDIEFPGEGISLANFSTALMFNCQINFTTPPAVDDQMIFGVQCYFNLPMKSVV